MIELSRNDLVFTFPEVHPDAQLRITFQRTLRIPDDGHTYPLPPGLGSFPLRHVDDFAATIPEKWITHGGIMFPMYQSEALWINFNSKYLDRHRTNYPFAVKIATGKINAVTGQSWQNSINRRPQDYIVVPTQPWLDGYCIKKGIIRQFVAMPLGSGYSAEEQITGSAEHGGLQIIVFPMKRSVFEKRFPKKKKQLFERHIMCSESPSMCESSPDMGLAPGGRMRQEIFRDPFELSDWDTGSSNRSFVHLANSLVWRSITGEAPPTTPFTSREYTEAGLPWFDYYDDEAMPLGGSEKLSGLRSVAEMGKAKGTNPLPENESAIVNKVICLRKNLTKNQVREGIF
ncbi:MAG: hypothetical protein HGB26_02765 [Desulfobulbaceae bacterium]|nr:hypothetical protein [Desulfobulbaceae bacterium]